MISVAFRPYFLDVTRIRSERMFTSSNLSGTPDEKWDQTVLSRLIHHALPRTYACCSDQTISPFLASRFRCSMKRYVRKSP